jgi:hypothetical protein
MNRIALILIIISGLALGALTGYVFIVKKNELVAKSRRENKSIRENNFLAARAHYWSSRIQADVLQLKSRLDHETVSEFKQNLMKEYTVYDLGEGRYVIRRAKLNQYAIGIDGGKINAFINYDIGK